MDLLFGSFLFAVILTLITMVFLVKQSEAVLLYCATAVMFDIFDTLLSTCKKNSLFTFSF